MGCKKTKPRRGTCKDHGVLAYSERWDSYYCPVTNKWLEPPCKCSPDECEYVGRPETAQEDFRTVWENITEQALSIAGEKEMSPSEAVAFAVELAFRVSTAEIDALRAERDRLKIAVEHYADGKNWETSERDVADFDLYRPEDFMLTHGFEVARAALEEKQNE